MNFENTQIAFAYKSDTDLKRAYFLFSFIRYKGVTYIFSRLIPLLIKWKFPVQGIIRKTIFKQFIAGENLYETQEVIRNLNKYNVQAILDYGVEGGVEVESVKIDNAEGFIRSIQSASSKPMIPFVSIKISAIASVSLLEKIDSLMQQESGSLIEKYQQALNHLIHSEKEVWERAVKRLHKILGIAALYKVKVLVDAEESWIQNAIDGLITQIVPFYNKEFALVYYTVQLYRRDRLSFLYSLYAYSKAKNLKLGVKLVRGAYMEKERRRAMQKNYPPPIHLNKEAVDKDFDAAITFCVDHSQDIEVVLATHNEFSCMLAVKLLKSDENKAKKINFHFSQLFGMSDHITFTLAKEGFAASKYLPYGPPAQVVPYLMRRAQENSSVEGQSNREFDLIVREIKRRCL
jgi:proline dehydrogenase